MDVSDASHMSTVDVVLEQQVVVTPIHKTFNNTMTTTMISQLGWSDGDDLVLLESIMSNTEIPSDFRNNWFLKSMLLYDNNSLNKYFHEHNSPHRDGPDFLDTRRAILQKLITRFRRGAQNPSIIQIFTTDDTKMENEYEKAHLTEEKINKMREYYNKFKKDTTSEQLTVSVPPAKTTKPKKTTSKSSPQTANPSPKPGEENLWGSTKNGVTIKFTGNGSLSNDPSFIIMKGENNDKRYVNGVKLFVMTSNSKSAPLVFQDVENFNHFSNLLKEDLGEPVDDFVSLNRSILACINDTCEVLDNNLLRKHSRIAVSKQSFSKNTIRMIHNSNDAVLTLKLTGKTLVAELKQVVNELIQQSNLENEEEFQEDLENETDKKNDNQITLHIVIESINETDCLNCSYEIHTSENIENYMHKIKSDEHVRQRVIDQAKLSLQLPTTSFEDYQLIHVEAGERRSIKVTCKATIPNDPELGKLLTIQGQTAHKVFFEQRVIANELFKRTKSLIGEDRFSQFDNLEFLVCSPNQNTLYEQNMKRLTEARTGILFGPIEQVAVKYFKDHIKIFKDFKNRATQNKNTLYVIIADECHYAITKGNAHDIFVNDWQHVGTDSWAMSMDNVFVLQVSATPYNILSKDSIFPERYVIEENLTAYNTKTEAVIIPPGHVIRVLDDSYSQKNASCVIGPFEQHAKYGAKFESSELKHLGEVYSITSSRLPDHFGDLKPQDLVIATKVNDSYEVYPINTTSESKAIVISGREFNSKLSKSNDVFYITHDISCSLNIKLDSMTIDHTQPQRHFRKGEVVQVFKRIRWKVKFVDECSDGEIYEADDLELRFATGCCCEENIVTWSKAQKANDHSKEIVRDHDEKFDMKYRSKSFYISTMKTNRPLIRQDKFFNTLIGECKTVASILRPPLLAIDYYFSILNYTFAHSTTITTLELLTQFLNADSFVLDAYQRTFIQASKYFYLSCVLEQFCQQYSISEASFIRILQKHRSILKPTKNSDDDDDADYQPTPKKKSKKISTDNFSSETKKSKKKTKTDREADLLLGTLRTYISSVQKEIDDASKNHDSELCRIFSKLLEHKKQTYPVDISLETERNNYFTETDAVVRDLFDSCQIKGDRLKGKMKIIRVTSTPYATAFQEVLMGAIQFVIQQNQGTVKKYPEVLKDTGKDYLTLDQLSATYQNAMAEKLLRKDMLARWRKGQKRLAKEYKTLTYEQLIDLPCILILVQKGRQGDTFPRSFNLLDMRSKGESLPHLSSFTQEIGRMCRYATDEELLPQAIVPASYFRELMKTCESTSLSRSSTSMSLDKYLTKRGSMQPQDYWDMVTYCRRMTKAVEGKVRVRNAKGKNTGEVACSTVASFDFGRSPNSNPSDKIVHRRRLLLYAEPQIGKTDAFIHYLQLLQDSFFESHPISVPDQPYEDINMEDCILSRKEDWILPYHDYVLNAPARKIAEYTCLTPGKYGKRVFEKREEAMMTAQSCDKERSKLEFATMIYRIECSLLSSQQHKLLLQQFLQSSGQRKKDYLTYDGRFIDLYNEMYERKRGTIRIENGVVPQHTDTNKNENTMKDETSESTEPTNSTCDLMNKGIAKLSRDGLIIYRDVPKTFNISERLKYRLLALGCSEQHLPQFSIPKSKLNKFTFDHGLIDGICQEISSEGSGDVIRYWIFMPSFQRVTSGLFYLDAIEKNCSYGQIIVVQQGEEFENYVEMLGHDHIIMSLPVEIDLGRLYEHLWNDVSSPNPEWKIYEYVASAVTGKIGFSRLSIQLIAHVLQLPFIWMIDDQVTHFEEIDFENDRMRRRCSMDKVLRSLERVMSDDIPLNSIQNGAMNMELFLTTQNGVDKKIKYGSNDELTENDTIASHTGGTNQYALIGIRKDGYRYINNAKYRPFLASHAVCSVFLLNVRTTIEKRVLFPAREYQEDIEFAYVCEEQNLICLKSQRFFVAKTQNRLRMVELDVAQPSLLLFSHTLNSIKNATDHIKITHKEISDEPSEEYKAILEQFQADGKCVTHDCHQLLTDGFDNGVCVLSLSHVQKIEDEFWPTFSLYLEYRDQFSKMTQMNKIRHYQYFSPQREEVNIREIIITVDSIIREDYSNDNKRTRTIQQEDSPQSKIQKVL